MSNFNSLLTPEFIWCVIGIALLVTEFAMPGFVIFFFGVGALFVALLCFFTDAISINMQLIIFLVSSIIFLIVLRKWFTTIFKGFFSSKDKMPLNKESYIGEKATVTEKITPLKKGKIEFHGSMWNAESNEEISKDTPVVIIEQNNLTFKVKPLIENK